MSLRPYLTDGLGLTREAHDHVRASAVKYGRWLKTATVEGRVPCPTCNSRLDQPASWPCPECAPYRKRKAA